jgi:hypothetical protein
MNIGARGDNTFYKLLSNGRRPKKKGGIAAAFA